MSGHLCSSLAAVDWNSFPVDFCANKELASTVEDANLRLAIWANQLEKIEAGNPALPFIREMQASGHSVASLIALGLYKPAAASMRATVECALYYIYFRCHIAELHTLAREESFYISKAQIVDFCRAHSIDFTARQATVDFVGRLNTWYSTTSAIVHGQMPGAWTSSHSLGGAPFDLEKALEVVDHFREAVSLVHDSFICTISVDMWKFVDVDAKKVLIRGMSGDLKEKLGLFG